MNREIMKQMGFTKEVEMVDSGLCPMCGDHVNLDDFRNEISLKEFRISGMCQFCQDRFFTRNNK